MCSYVLIIFLYVGIFKGVRGEGRVQIISELEALFHYHIQEKQV